MHNMFMLLYMYDDIILPPLAMEFKSDEKRHEFQIQQNEFKTVRANKQLNANVISNYVHIRRFIIGTYTRICIFIVRY